MSKAAHWIAVVLCVCALWALGGCGAGESSSSASEYVGSSSSDKSGASSESSSGASLPVEPPKPVRPEKPFGFERLDPEQQEMYRLL